MTAVGQFAASSGSMRSTVSVLTVSPARTASTAVSFSTKVAVSNIGKARVREAAETSGLGACAPRGRAFRQWPMRRGEWSVGKAAKASRDAAKVPSFGSTRGVRLARGCGRRARAGTTSAGKDVYGGARTRFSGNGAHATELRSATISLVG